VKKVARMCKGRLANTLTFFEHHLTNGLIQGLNNQIQVLSKKAFGYCNKKRLKTDILFRLGGPKLYPGR
jgi:transposase